MQLSETSLLTLLTYGLIRNSSIAFESKLGQMMTLSHQCVQSSCLPCEPGDHLLWRTSLFTFFYRVQRHGFFFNFCLLPVSSSSSSTALGSISGLGMPVI